MLGQLSFTMPTFDRAVAAWILERRQPPNIRQKYLF
jgi:hypothetical protein